jgi:hypothetical protein
MKDKDLFGMLVLFGRGILVFVAIVLAWPGLNIKVDYTTVLTVLAPLMLSVLFSERAIEVMILSWRYPAGDQRARVLNDATNNREAIASQHAAVECFITYRSSPARRKESNAS